MPPHPREAPSLGPDSLLRQLLEARDRDAVPGAQPIVSFHESDDPEFLAELDALGAEAVELERRGVWHGRLALLTRLAPHQASRPALAQRWADAQPIVLREQFDPGQVLAEDLAARRRLHDELKDEGGLRRFLSAARDVLAPEFSVHHRVPDGPLEERDIERVELHFSLDSGSRRRRMRDLWAKSAWLSTYDGDESLRVRFSFGQEVEDDASRDIHRHRCVSELVQRLLPEAEWLASDPILAESLERFLGQRSFLTQHIAYWNAPDGGALFHHDAFAEEVSGGQRGVVYAQFSGATLWLSLSVEQLATRTRELGELLLAGEMSWVAERLRSIDPGLVELCAGPLSVIARELALPACGRLAPVVNQGPEFTALLADAGHAFLVEPGDVVLLPNHGYKRTAMHSVFCASDEPGYALSMAVREQDPLPRPG